MKLHTIETGYFKLDGGAMFGVVPKRMWEKLNPPDGQNLCTWIMRCLLIETDDRKILVDTGMGNKQGEKFRSHFKPHGDKTLIDSLGKINVYPKDITDVFLTHLHFDHVGGAVSLNKKSESIPTFINATYWSGKDQWESAKNPNARERASYLKENFIPLEDAGVVKFIERKDDLSPWISGIQVKFVDGHSEGMMVPIIEVNNKLIIFTADLLPSSFHVGMPYVMSYDIRPLVTLKEKSWLYQFITDKEAYIFLEHDPVHELISIKKNERGRYVVDQYYKLSDVLS